jgi:hypothetical protein
MKVDKVRAIAAVRKSIPVYQQRMAMLASEDYPNLELAIHVWSGSDYNQFYPLTDVSEAVNDFAERIEIDDHARLYMDIDSDGDTPDECCVLAYDNEDEGVEYYE